MVKLDKSRKVLAAVSTVLALTGVGAGVATAAALTPDAPQHRPSQVDSPEPGDHADRPGQVDTPEPGDHADQPGQVDTPEPGDHADRPGQVDTPEPGDHADQPGQ